MKTILPWYIGKHCSTFASECSKCQFSQVIMLWCIPWVILHLQSQLPILALCSINFSSPELFILTNLVMIRLSFHDLINSHVASAIGVSSGRNRKLKNVCLHRQWFSNLLLAILPLPLLVAWMTSQRRLFLLGPGSSHKRWTGPHASAWP